MPTPARKGPDSSFNENSPAGIAVNALLMAANAMDPNSEQKEDGDKSSDVLETNDSESIASEEETDTRVESVPKTPAEARRAGMETKTKTNESASEQHKTDRKSVV